MVTQDDRPLLPNNGVNNDNNCGDHDHKDIFAGHDTIFNLDISFLADALAPKSPLCDRKFQLSRFDTCWTSSMSQYTSTSSTQQATTATTTGSTITTA